MESNESVAAVLTNGVSAAMDESMAEEERLLPPQAPTPQEGDPYYFCYDCHVTTPPFSLSASSERYGSDWFADSGPDLEVGALQALQKVRSLHGPFRPPLPRDRHLRG